MMGPSFSHCDGPNPINAGQGIIGFQIVFHRCQLELNVVAVVLAWNSE